MKIQGVVSGGTGLVPQSTGFVGDHLYEGPELERAIEICSAINDFALEDLGLATADPKKVTDLTLREMIDAKDTVERFNTRPKIDSVTHSIFMVPDERLISAVYTLVHFCERSPCGDADDDHIPVRFTQRWWGEDYVQFLLIGNREKKAVEPEDEDET